MAKIISIGTALPDHKNKQSEILNFMLDVYEPEESDRRKISLLYERSGIKYRYSSIPDYGCNISDREFYPKTRNIEPFPTLEKRMEWYHPRALELSVRAVKDCVKNLVSFNDITHLITVSCTGLSAPGLDIALMQKLKLKHTCERTSVNFMGCYAALHALKMANYIATAEPDAKVLVVCTELCTLHFQKEFEMDHIASSLLFGDGSAAVLISGDNFPGKGLRMENFYSEVNTKGLSDMAWHLSGKGFLMTLSSYIPDLIKSGIGNLLNGALSGSNHKIEDIKHWAIHPGGRKILETIAGELNLSSEKIKHSFSVLENFGNMSSPTVLFVIKEVMENERLKENELIFSAAFGPGLTMETVIFKVV